MSQNEMVFMRKEIDSLKVMQHPNIVQMVEVFEDERSFYLVLEYLRGGDMYEYLKHYLFNVPEKRAQELAK